LVSEIKEAIKKAKRGGVQNFSQVELSNAEQIKALTLFLEEKRQALDELFNEIDVDSFYNYGNGVVESDQLHIQLEELGRQVDQLAGEELNRVYNCISDV